MKTRPTRNKQYVKGANFERAVRKYFEEHNFRISRAAGSHGMFDLQGHDDSSTWDIQCKYGSTEVAATRLVEKLKNTLIEQYPMLRIPLVVAVMYAWRNKQPVGVHRILLPNVEKVDEVIKPDAEAGEEPESARTKTLASGNNKRFNK
jgi:hypothetical protein